MPADVMHCSNQVSATSALKSFLSIPTASLTHTLTQSSSSTTHKDSSSSTTHTTQPPVSNKKQRKKSKSPTTTHTQSSTTPTLTHTQSTPSKGKPPTTKSTKKSKTKSPVDTPSLTHSPPKAFFAGSAFQNSPDPYSIPMPDFDFDDESECVSECVLPPAAITVSEVVTEQVSGNVSINGNSKTLLLRNMLKVKGS